MKELPQIKSLYKWSLVSAVFLASLSSQAQKKPVDHSVYDSWQSIGATTTTPNGQWVSYTIKPQEGDQTLIIRNTNDLTQFDIARSEGGSFTVDSQKAIGLIKPFYKDIKAVKTKKLKEEKLEKDSLFIVDLKTKQVQKIAKVKSFILPKENSQYLAYLTHITPDSTAKGAKKPAVSKDKKDKEAFTLKVRDLVSSSEKEFKNVTDFVFSENGTQLAFITKAPKKDSLSKSGIFIYQTKADKLITLSTEKGEYSKLSFNKKSDQLAYVFDDAPEKALQRNHALHLVQTATGKKIATFNTKSKGMPSGWNISEFKEANFSENGKNLYLGIAPIPTVKDTTLVALDHADLDIWGKNDDYIMPIQLKNLKRDQEKSYTAFVDLSKPDRLVSLSNETLENTRLVNKGDATFVLASTDFGNRISSQWVGGTSKTHYIVDVKTGKKTLIVADLNGNITASPKGKFVVYYNEDNKNWYAFNTQNSQTKQLNSGLNVSFADEENDVPSAPNSYGIGSFTEDDQTVLVYDRYDIWAFDLAGKKAAYKITDGRGDKITYRIPKLNEDQEAVSLDKPIVLVTFDNKNKQQGIATIDKKGQQPKQFLNQDVKGFETVKKAKLADVYIYTKESYKQSPNLFVTSNFTAEKQLSQTNSQQDQYNWLTAELVKWTTPKGYQSEGILYKPENFDANKQYPMIVYFYEKVTDNINRYEAPAPTPSRLNIAYFVSNGYLVFAPNISYLDGYPGQSAEEYINSGVEMLKKNNWVNPNKIGIQGQSWGGYQVAHLITRTNMYAAAWAGAPVVNMTSAYGGIRWGSGMTRQFQYEKTQSRIGANLWEKTDLYLENSPLFYMNQVNTPVAIMHNDQDGAVPWYQGIEMYTALRRLNKPVWMLNYNGDDHNLMKRQNRKDIQIRQQQFFDFYLKDAKAPVWMVKGVPAVKKGIDWGFELTDEKP